MNNMCDIPERIAIVKISIIYHSETGNTKQQAELIAEGAKRVEGAEVRLMSIEKPDNDWIKDSAR